MKTAILPATARSGVALRVRSRACDPEGNLLSADNRPSDVQSRLVVELWGRSESALHRAAALLLLQVGGFADFDLTRHDECARYLSAPVFHAVVVLSPNSEVVL